MEPFQNIIAHVFFEKEKKSTLIRYHHTFTSLKPFVILSPLRSTSNPYLLLRSHFLEQRAQLGKPNRLQQVMIHPRRPRLEPRSCRSEPRERDDARGGKVRLLFVISDRARCRHAVEDGHGHVCFWVVWFSGRKRRPDGGGGRGGEEGRTHQNDVESQRRCFFVHLHRLGPVLGFGVRDVLSFEKGDEELCSRVRTAIGVEG